MKTKQKSLMLIFKKKNKKNTKINWRECRQLYVTLQWVEKIKICLFFILYNKLIHSVSVHSIQNKHFMLQPINAFVYNLIHNKVKKM